MLACAGSCATLAAAYAADIKTSPPISVAASDDIWTRSTLTGDWNGVRTRLEDAGFSVDITQTMDVLSNANGGFRQGATYDGLLEVGIDIDLDKLAGWKGGMIHASGFFVQGRGLSQYYLGNLLTVTSVEAPEQNRLGELWFQQSFFDDALEVKVGQILADQSFVISDTAGVFVNSTFGFPGSFGTDLPGGGPAYPMATPGVQVVIKPDDAWTLQVALFNGNPTGSGANPHGFAFPMNDGAFAIAEAAYSYAPDKGQPGLPGTYKVGGWYNSESFDSLLWSTDGLSLADPASNGIAAQYRGDYAFYAVVDQTLWQEPGSDDQGLSGFARVTVSPQGRNQISWYFDLGLAYTGLFAGRDDDIFGVGFAYARMSSSLAELAGLTNLYNGTTQPTPDYEAVLEVTYQAAITPWLSVQPFFQYVFHPGGNAPNPSNQNVAIRDAAVFGLRTAMTF